MSKMIELTEDQMLEIARALRLYQRLNNDNRSGCELTEDDWGQCYRAGEAALMAIPQAIRAESRKVFDQPPFVP